MGKKSENEGIGEGGTEGEKANGEQGEDIGQSTDPILGRGRGSGGRTIAKENLSAFLPNLNKQKECEKKRAEKERNGEARSPEAGAIDIEKEGRQGAKVSKEGEEWRQVGRPRPGGNLARLSLPDGMNEGVAR